MSRTEDGERIVDRLDAIDLTLAQLVDAVRDKPKRRLVRLSNPREGGNYRLVDPAAVVGLEPWTRTERPGTMIHLAGGDSAFLPHVTVDEVAAALGLAVDVAAAGDNQAGGNQ